jgi:hypothetical protein
MASGATDTRAQPVALTVTHAGIVTTMIYELPSRPAHRTRRCGSRLEVTEGLSAP